MTFMYTLLLTEFSEVGIFSQAGAKSCLGALFVAILNHGHCRAEKKKNNNFNLSLSVIWWKKNKKQLTFTWNDLGILAHF